MKKKMNIQKTVLKLFMLLLTFIGFRAAAQTTQTFSTSGTYTVPAGVTSITVSAWGGGGAGGGVNGNSTGRAGGGGEGGAFVRGTVTVLPGATYTVVVGSGGAGVLAANGGAGQASSFSVPAGATLFNAIGGTFGAVANNFGAGGNAANSGNIVSGTTTSNFYGGNGGTATSASTASSGGGGGSAGAGGNGGNGGSPLTGGTAGVGSGSPSDPGIVGATGRGSQNDGDGIDGGIPGAGGSGARNANNNTDYTGGDGGAGQVKVTWTCPSYAITATSGASPICTSAGTSTITLTGSAAGLPVGTYTVTYNRSVPSATGLTAAMTVSVAGSGSFSATGLTTAGSSTITVTNLSSGTTGGTCSSNIASNNTTVITVNGAPSITTQPSSQTICTGNPVTFTVAGSGSPAPTYQWKKGGVDISGATLASYNITSISGTDAATYTVGLTNSCNTVTSNNAVLTVNTPPSISVQPVSQTKCAGNSVTFSVTAAGTSPTYQWRKGGVTISGATLSSYTIASVAAVDAASYDVVVSVANCTSLPSSAAVLTVNLMPTVYSVSGGGVYCQNGAGSAVGLSNSQSGVNYQLKIGSVATGSPVAGTNASISFGNQTAAGTYTVDATNATTTCAQAMTGSVAVSINPAPTAVSATPSSSLVCASATSVALAGSATTTSIATVNNDNFDGTPTYTGSGSTTGNRSQIFAKVTSGTTVNSIATFTSTNGGGIMIATAGASAIIGTSTSSANSLLTSASINTNNFTTLTLSYRHTYKQGNSGSPSGKVEVSTNGSTWTTLKTFTTDQGGATSFVADNITLSNTYLNQSNLQLRFNFVSSNSSFLSANASWWAVDDVLLNGNPVALFSWTANTGSGVNGLPGGAGTGSAANKNITVVPSATTIYTITAADAVTGCTSTSTSTVTVNPIATVSAGSIQTICSNETATMNGSFGGGASSGTWSTSGTGSFNNNSVNAIYTPSAADIAAGSVTITYTTDDPAGPCGAANAQKILTINAVPAISSQPAAITLCENGNATFSISASGTGIGYQWRKGTTNLSNGGTISGATSATFHINGVVTADAASDYNCVVSGACTPDAISNSVALVVNTAPAISSVGDLNVNTSGSCNASVINSQLLAQISTSGSPAPSVTFNPAAGNFNLGSANVTATAVNGCGSVQTSFNVIVHDNEAPVANCQNINVNLDNAGIISITGALLNNASTDNCSIDHFAVSQTSFDCSNIGVNNVTLMAYDASGNFSACAATVTVNDISAPVPNVASLAALNGECSVTANIPTATDNCAGVINATTEDALVYNAQGTYIIHWNYNDSHGNSVSQNQSVIVQDVSSPVPVVSSLPNISAECSASATPPVAIDNCAGTIIATTTDATTYNAAGNYTIHWVYDDGNGNIVSQNQAVIVTSPAATISGNNSICNGNNSSVHIVFSGTAPFNYTISDGTQSVSGSTSNNVDDILIPAPAEGVHIYTLTAFSDAICSGTSLGTANVTVIPIPNIAMITSLTGSNEVCNGTVVQFTANIANGSGFNYSWNTGTNQSIVTFSNDDDGPFVSGPFQSSSNTVYVQFGSLIGTSGYNVCVEISNMCGSSGYFCKWIRGQMGTPGNISGSAIACSNQAGVNYSVASIVQTAVYNWTFSVAGASFTGQGTNNVSVNFPSFTSGQLCVTAALSCGGSSTSAPRCITISNVTGLPSAISGPSKICPGSTNVAYSVSPLTGAISYNWTVPSGVSIVESAPYSNSIHVNFPANYTGAPAIFVYGVSSCGVQSAGRSRTVGSLVPNTPGSITGPVAAICNSTVQYSIANVSGATGYTWTIPSGANNFIGQGSTSIQFTAPTGFTIGNVTVQANTNACSPGTSGLRSISVTGAPATPGVITVNPSAWCVGQTINASVATASPLPYYNWIITNGNIDAGQGSNNIDVITNNSHVIVQVRASNACGNSGNRTLHVYSAGCREDINQPVSVSQLLSVYPNPAHENLTVSIVAKQNSDISLTLTDISGRVVLKEKLAAAAGMNKYDVNLNHLSKGMYMMQADFSGEFQETKVVIE